MSPSRLRTFAMAAVLACAGGSARAVQTDHGDGLTVQERRGKAIYFGTAPGIKARVGTPPADAPPMLLACANCHGRDARGNREAGVVASDIRWETLTKPYGVTHPTGRSHPAYTTRSFVRAVSLGVDPAGTPLHAAMPRFQMSHSDIDALTGYLKRLSTVLPPGVSADEIRVGTVVPSSGPRALAGSAVRAVLAAYFDSVNQQGGIYGRRLALTPVVTAAADAKADVDRLVHEGAPLAMVAGVIDPTGDDLIAAAESWEIPFVGPLTIFPELAGPARTTFYLLSGVEQQARALLEFARGGANAGTAKTSGTSPLALTILHAPDTVPPVVVERIRDYGDQAGWTISIVKANRADLEAEKLAPQLAAAAATHALLLVGGDQLISAAAAMRAIGWAPTLLVPGSLATNDLLKLSAALSERLLIALPSLPSDQTQAALAEYRALADAYHLPPTDVASQFAALGSAKLLTHALRIAGRGVTRASLVAELERLSDFESGLLPRIGFNRGRHIGAPGAYIVTLDPARKEFKQLTGWLRVD
jgi:ABC-type branched-subunit amino acid transport system substrate-binding protein